ncbi:MAG: glycosyl transferase, partial [Bacteroidota bacterium]|nr:glycosyl transferase [Bacteroidota bacterium]
VHIAAAVGTPIVVLYAQTNPQHTPWKVPNRVLQYAVEVDSRSKNEVIQYLYKEVYKESTPLPDASEIITAVTELLSEIAYKKSTIKLTNDSG